MTETYRDRFEWDAQFCAAGCCVWFCHLLSSTQKHVGHHLTAQQAIH